MREPRVEVLGRVVFILHIYAHGFLRRTGQTDYILEDAPVTPTSRNKQSRAEGRAARIYGHRTPVFITGGILSMFIQDIPLAAEGYAPTRSREET